MQPLVREDFEEADLLIESGPHYDERDRSPPNRDEVKVFGYERNDCGNVLGGFQREVIED